MSDWIEGYRQAVKDSLARYGTIGDRSYYGRISDRSLTAHFKTDPQWREYLREQPPAWCGGWKSFSNPEEDTVSEFVDTFFEGDDSKVIITAKVTCECGYITDAEIETDGTISEMIQAVLREA
jgi:hypothetical protein